MYGMRDFGVSHYFAELDSMHVSLTFCYDQTKPLAAVSCVAGLRT
jgi:hypothetical protein